MAAKMTLEGTYMFRFDGFDRADDHACYVSGVGTVKMSANAITGVQRVTNSPMSGLSRTLHFTTYALSGSYTIDDAGPPLMATATVLFTEQVPGGRKLSDQFAVVQSGPDRLRLISTKPHDEVRGVDVQELVSGELIKVDEATW